MTNYSEKAIESETDGAPRRRVSVFKRNVLSIYAANVANGLLSLVAIPLALQFLGTEGYGLLALHAISLSYVALADMAVGKNLQRLLASEKSIDRRVGHLRSALAVYSLISLALLVTAPAILYFVPIYVFPVGTATSGKLKWLLAFAILEYIATIPISIIQINTIAEEKAHRFAVFNTLSGVIRYGTLFFGLIALPRLEWVVGILALRRLLEIPLARAIMGNLPAGAWIPRFNWSEIAKLVSASAGLSLAQISQQTLLALPSLLTTHLVGLETFGVFRAAWDLASRTWFLSNGLGVAIFPRLVRLQTSKSTALILENFSMGAMTVSWGAFCCISALGTYAAPWILALLHVGDLRVQPLFVITLLGVCLNAHANISYELLQAGRRYNIATALTVGALLIMFGSSAMLLSLLGIYAVVSAWALSQCIYAIGADLFSLHSFSFAETSVRVVLLRRISALAMPLSALACYFGYLPLMVALSLGAAFAIILMPDYFEGLAKLRAAT